MADVVDVGAFVRSILSAVGIGVLLTALAFFLLQRRDQWVRWRAAAGLGVSGLCLLIALLVYYVWPSLVSVPSLDRLSEAECQALLLRQHLVPNGHQQYTSGVETGRVIPHSQSPAAGLTVRRSTTVTFAVAINQSTIGIPSALDVTLSRPRAREAVHCAKAADGVYKFEVQGTSLGASTGGARVLLWVRLVNPPSDTGEWYLERPPINGVQQTQPDGSWSGTAQIGNTQWPPSEGNTMDVAVSIADDATVAALLAEPGVVMRSTPVGVKSDVARGVVVTLK